MYYNVDIIAASLCRHLLVLPCQFQIKQDGCHAIIILRADELLLSDKKIRNDILWGLCVVIATHPLQVQESIAGIIAAENVSKKEAILAWDGEKRPISKYCCSHAYMVSPSPYTGMHHP